MKNNLAHIDVNIPSINNFVVSFNNKSNLWINISNIDNITGHIYKHIDDDIFYNLYELSFNSHIKEKLKVKIPTTDKIININGYNIPETLVKEIKEIANSILDYILSNKSYISTNNKRIVSSLNTKLGKFSTLCTKYKGTWLQPLLNKEYEREYTNISVIFHNTKYPFHFIIETDYNSYATLYYKQKRIITLCKNVGYNSLSIIQQLLPVIYDLYDYHESCNKYTEVDNLKNTSNKLPNKLSTSNKFGKCIIFNNEMFLAKKLNRYVTDWSNLIPIDKDSKYLFKKGKDVAFKLVNEFKEQWCEAQDTYLKKMKRFRLPKPTGRKVAKILTLKP